MPTPYTGNPANVTNLLQAAVSGASNTSPIEMTTAAPHGFSTGDLVSVVGVAGNTAANNRANQPWTIDVTAANKFTLRGSKGNGAYSGSGGTVVDLSLTPGTQTASGADPILTLNTPIQASLDRSQFLTAQQPALYLVNRYTVQSARTFVAAWATATLAVTNAWQFFTVGTGTSEKLFTATSSPTSFATVPTNGNCYGWNPGDVLDVSLTGVLANISAGPDPFGLGLTWEDDLSAATLLVGAEQQWLLAAGADTGVHLRGSVTNANSGTGAAVDGSLGSGVWEVSGLTGMTASCVGSYLRLGGSSVPGNNGTFLITAYASPTQVDIYNPNAALDTAYDMVWGICGSRFNVGLQVAGVAGDSPSMYGPYSLIVNHYRSSTDPLFYF